MNQTTDFDHRLLEIYGELSRDRLMELVVGYARDRLDADGSSIFLRDSITGRYVLRGTTGLLESGQMPDERIEYEPGEGLTGWIAKYGQPLCIANVKDHKALQRIAKDLIWSKKFTEVSPDPDRAYLGVPILSQDKHTVLGVLRVSGKQFDAQDEALLEHVANMVSIAIENSQRYEQEKRRARYFQLLLGISGELDPRRSITDMLQGVAEQVREGFRTEACLIHLRTEEDIHQMVLRAASGLPGDMVGKLVYAQGEGLTGCIAAEGRGVQIREPAELQEWRDPHMAKIAVHLPSGICRSFIGVPLQLGEEVLGTLELVNKIPSAPGHRDWFTDDDEQYLRLLSTAIGGALEGARYLRALNDVGITAMRMQQVASFGTLAQRILHETANPLAVARLAMSNLHSTLHDRSDRPPPHEEAVRRSGVITSSLDEVSEKLFNLLTFSQRIGFVRTTTDWNEVVRGALILLMAERHWRGVEVHASYEDLPPLSIEPNETFGIVVTMLRLAMEALDPSKGLIQVCTSLDAKSQRVHTTICAAEAPLRAKVLDALEPNTGMPGELSPIRFEWALAQETVEVRYGGSLTWHVQDEELCFTLELPLEKS